MIRFIQWVLSGCLAIGVGSALADMTLKLGKAAVYAHKNDQMSYSKFTRALLEAKPRQKPSTGSNQ